MEQALNFGWIYADHFNEEYLHGGMLNAKQVDIPHTNIGLPVNNIDEKSYQFTSTYQKIFSLAPAQRGKRAFVHFEGAAHHAKVYLNGEYLGEHKGGYTPFTFEMTKALAAGENLLVLVLNASEEQNMPPFGKVIDYLTFGGLYREVSLVFKNEDYIEDVYVYGRHLLTSPEVVFEVELNAPLKADITFSLSHGGKQQLFKGRMAGKTQTFAFALSEVALWDLDTPNLYEVKVSIAGVDGYTTRTGFRQAQFTPSGFMLNGNKVDIVGLNRHQSYPYVGYAMPKTAQVSDAHIIKNQLGCNLARTSHYPQSKHFLDACDELGLLVMEEFPGWQNIGNEAWKEISLQHIREMILAHRNHPSIILWGVRINESLDDHPYYQRTNALARQLDPQRQTGGVRNIEMVKPDKEAWLEDVYTYNDFDYREGHALTEPEMLLPMPGIPALVTEHSGHTFPTKSFDGEARRLTHALRHTGILNHMMGDKRISGAVGWCAFDYNTHIEFGSGDRICYHGVMDIFRMPKMAALAYATQGVREPILETSTNFTIGDYDRAVIVDAYLFTNCDYVEMYRNGEYVARLMPDRETYPHLPHPPIPIDWFGDVLVEKEGFSKEKSDRFKKIHHAINKYGVKEIPAHYDVYVKRPQEIDEVLALHGRYIQNWSSKAVVYRFVGFIGDTPVKEISRGGEYTNELKIWAESNTLTIGDTYDVVRVCCECVNENGFRLAYASDVLTIETDGKLEIIGEDKVALVGGTRAFWVKTKADQRGASEVKVSYRGTTQTLAFTVL